jgi:hypothetical protein
MQPVVFLLILAMALVVGSLLGRWIRIRRSLREYYSESPVFRWLEAPAAPPGEKGEILDRELEELGYRHVGYLEPEGVQTFFGVYVHNELPIYALAVMAWDSEGVFATLPQMETFLPEGGRLSTTGDANFGRYVGGVETGAPRLVQFRAFGPSTAAAMDGQHLGTVRAWMARRELLPATKEALLDYMQRDFEALRDGLERIGWLPLGDYLRVAAGKAKGVLKF